MISDTALHTLTTAANAKRRKGSTTIKVDAAALDELIRTHHELYDAAKRSGRLSVTLGPDHASLVGDLSATDAAALSKALAQRAR